MPEASGASRGSCRSREIHRSALLKDSSLVSVITVVELTKQTSIFATNIGSWALPGAICAALYLLMSLPLARFARRLENRWKVAVA